MIDDVLQSSAAKMGKSVSALQKSFLKIRTGRAHPSLLESVMVSYYGTDTVLTQVASVTVEDSRTLKVTPWEKDMVTAIEKAILASGLGLNPTTQGAIIRIPLPPLTEERRHDLVKIIKNEAEHGRISIRNIRRDANSQMKEFLKENLIGKDEARVAEEKVQKITNQYIKEVEKHLEDKEADLLSM